MPSIRGLITGTNAAVWRTVNKAGVPWHKLPGPAGALNLAALREDLRHDNLHDTRDDAKEGGHSEEEIAGLPSYRTYDLMASRRLKSNRFFTRDYTPEVYTPEGLDWIDRHTMADVIVRHHPELAPALAGSRNAFAPWRKSASGGVG